MRILTYCSLLLLFFSSEGFAQQTLGGKIHKKGSSELLMSVTVENLSSHRFNESDIGGNYRIAAQQGDSVIFSSTAYRPDTLIVSAFMLAEGFDIYLQPHVETLAAVRVGSLSNYQIDSIERWKDYDWVAPKQKVKLVDRTREAGDGVGISFSPQFKTHEDKEKARLKKRLDEEEQEFYIDFRFSREYVVRLTHFQGDSLQTFMKDYRPTYGFCREATSQDMLLYVNDSMKKFKKEE
jgi:hypothetical protein